MKVLGIIAEYNPFHNGHSYQLDACRQLAGADYTVIAMSGNFTQRGKAAITDKYVRTQMALDCGADLVIELPVHAACASAGYFAFGGVSLLAHTGIVTHLGFGSECGDIRLLEQAAQILSQEPEDFKAVLKAGIKSGQSYALARQKALESCFPKAFGLLTPNNILGIEYIRAIQKTGAPILPVTVRRQSSGYHDLSLGEHFCSAKALRRLTFEQPDFKAFDQYMPKAAASAYISFLKDFPPVSGRMFSGMLYYALSVCCHLEQIEDMDEFLASRISKLLGQYQDFDSFCMHIKSKNYTMTRIARALTHVMLGITQKDMQNFLQMEAAPYVRILGFRKSAAPLLRALKGNSSIPVITKAADAGRRLNEAQLALFNQNLFADNLYRQVLNERGRRFIPHEFSRGLIIV